MTAIRPSLLLALALPLASVASNASAQEMVFQIDTAKSRVEFTLGDTLHTVRGTFRLKPSTIHFDPRTGAAEGAFVVDAASGETGNDSRDRKMRADELESARYPEIRYSVQRFEGDLAASGSTPVRLVGVMTLHGSDHPLTVDAPVLVTSGRAAADVRFVVPYVQWGMKNPSLLFLRVSDTIDIVVHAVGTVAPAAPSPARR